MDYEKLKDNSVRCGVCQRRCLISEDRTGFCLSKLNRRGKLLALNYGLFQGIQIDPIEKKPFYHFKPGALVPSLGSFGCNFRCKQCLNWSFSWGEPANEILKELGRGNRPQEQIEPQVLIEEIKKSGHRGIAFTYNEPIIWSEYVLDVAKLAKKEGFFTLFVSNGSWTKETIDRLGPFIDAANIDFKGFSEATYAKQGAFWGSAAENIATMIQYAQEKYGIFIEITTLLIPGVNDNPKELEEMTSWIVKNLGSKTPWHLSRFDPDLSPGREFRKIPATSVESLKKAASIGRRFGLSFVYVWAPGQEGYYSEGDTICPKCKNLAVKRTSWQPSLVGIDSRGRCSVCRTDLNIKL